MLIVLVSLGLLFCCREVGEVALTEFVQRGVDMLKVGFYILSTRWIHPAQTAKRATTLSAPVLMHPLQ